MKTQIMDKIVDIEFSGAQRVSGITIAGYTQNRKSGNPYNANVVAG